MVYKLLIWQTLTPDSFLIDRSSASELIIEMADWHYIKSPPHPCCIPQHSHTLAPLYPRWGRSPTTWPQFLLSQLPNIWTMWLLVLLVWPMRNGQLLRHISVGSDKWRCRWQNNIPTAKVVKNINCRDNKNWLKCLVSDYNLANW